jgi:hypothetical protein
MEIRSYRPVFDLERRIYRVDRLRLNPGGVPLRGVAYFLSLLAASAIASRLPGASALTRLVPWYLAYVAAPAAGAAVLTAIRLEGRPFHIAAQALARHLRYAGPGAVLVRVTHERVETVGPVIGRRARLRLRESVNRHPLDPGQVIALARGTRLRVH